MPVSGGTAREPIEVTAMSTLPGKIVPLPHRRRGLPWVSGCGAFGLALSLTTTSAYLPPLLEKFTEPRTLIALVLGSEGIFALTFPLVIGPWSDTFQTPMGTTPAVHARRSRAEGLSPRARRLHAEPLVDDVDPPWLLLRLLHLRTPYRGLYPEPPPQSQYGRAQGAQHVLRGVAIGVGLIGGGLLFDVWPLRRSSSRRSAQSPRAARPSCSFGSRPPRRTASSKACARTSRTACGSCARSRRCAAFSCATPRGRGRLQVLASSSCSTSRRGSASRWESAPRCSRLSQAATSSLQRGRADSATASVSRASSTTALSSTEAGCSSRVSRSSGTTGTSRSSSPSPLRAVRS